jgi:hypothetical protein
LARSSDQRSGAAGCALGLVVGCALGLVVGCALGLVVGCALGLVAGTRAFGFAAKRAATGAGCSFGSDEQTQALRPSKAANAAVSESVRKRFSRAEGAFTLP